MSVFCVVFVQSNKSRKCKDTKDVPNVYPLNIFYFPPTKDMFLPVSVCLSVSKITQNACMDFDEMLRVDRCRDMDKLPSSVSTSLEHLTPLITKFSFNG